MEAVIRQLQDTMVVLAAVEERNSAGLKDHTEWLEGQQMRLKDHERFIIEHERTMAEHERFIITHERTMAEHALAMKEHDRRMAEFDDKLNGLIAIVDGMIRGKQQ